MNLRKAALNVCLGLMMIVTACSRPTGTVTELRQFPADSLEGLIAQSDIQLDKEISSDGSGSLKISVSKPTVVRLYETGDLDIEDARLVYQAQVRTENVEGQVYLEMWCSFPEKGEFFSRGLQSPLSGTTSWKTSETPFFLNPFLV